MTEITTAMRPAVEQEDAELEAIAWGFLGSPYASTRFAEWTIDRRLHAYLRHQGRGDVADNGTRCAALLDRVMANIAAALDSGTLRPDGEVIITTAPSSKPGCRRRAPR
jgi:hypothetical protein